MTVKAIRDETIPMLQKKLQAQDTKDKKLREACSDFEAVFWGYMMKNMRKTVAQNQDNHSVDGNQKEIFQSMFDQELATEISRSKKSLGLGESLYRSLSRSYPTEKK